MRLPFVTRAQFYGGHVSFQTLATRFAPTPTTISGVFEKVGLKKVGDQTPTQHSIDLMNEIAADNKAIANRGGNHPVDASYSYKKVGEN